MKTKSTGIRIFTFWVLLIGIGGSLIMTFRTGQNNNSLLLMVLFMVWVTSPFTALSIIYTKSKNYLRNKRVIFFIVTIFITCISLIEYCGVLKFQGLKPAALFLILPLISWILIIITILFTTVFTGAKDSQKKKK